MKTMSAVRRRGRSPQSPPVLRTVYEGACGSGRQRVTESGTRPKPFGASIFDNWTKRRDAGATGHRTAPEPVLLSLLGVLESGSKGECGLTQRRKGAEVLGSRYPPSEASRASGCQSGAKPQFLPSFSKPPRLPAAKATQTKNRKQKGNTET